MRGIRLNGKKQQSLVTWSIRRPRPPARVRIPLFSYLNEKSAWAVEPGQRVTTGQTIAFPAGQNTVSVHASVTGKVRGIFEAEDAAGRKLSAVEIESEAQQDLEPGIGRERKKWEECSETELLEIFQTSGLFDTQTGEPLHRIVRRMKGKVHTLLVNACESEPYETAKHALLMGHSFEILKAAEIMRKLLGAEKAIFATEEDKREAAEILNSKIYLMKWDRYSVRILPVRYPQDDERVLMQSLFGTAPRDFFRERPSVHLVSPGTLFALYEAVVLQKPFYEKIVTVAGECVAEAQNVWIPEGSSCADAFKFCKGILRTPGRVLLGGPMRGTAIADLDAELPLSAESLVALPPEEMDKTGTSSCIRCHRCVEACPAGISPAAITLAVEKGEFHLVEEWEAGLCFDCGICSYVCPAKRPMADLMICAKKYAEEFFSQTGGETASAEKEPAAICS